ncbi:MAG: hypothetical protein Q9163_002318 [Psora crenata]
MFPSARLILIRGPRANIAHTPTSTQKRTIMGPVISAIRAANPASPIFLHLFSTLGAQSAGTLLTSLQGDLAQSPGMHADQGRTPNVITRSHLDLNDPALLSLDALKVYFYSKEDRLVQWQDIERHVATARERGWEVKSELFEGTPHFKHAKGAGEERYWGLVRKVVAQD